MEARYSQKKLNKSESNVLDTYRIAVLRLKKRTGGASMKDLKRKLTSRKFWASIASFTSMLLIYFGHAESEATQISALIMAGASIVGYVIGEGLADSSNSGGDDHES